MGRGLQKRTSKNVHLPFVVDASSNVDVCRGNAARSGENRRKSLQLLARHRIEPDDVGF